MIIESCWHAVYTRHKWERKVADAFTRLHVENYCPMNKIVRQWADRKKTIYTPLFTSYVFLKIPVLAHPVVKKTEGVLNFVYWLGKPAIIREEEISAIKAFLSEHANIRLEKIAVVESDIVRVLDGPLSFMEGCVVEVKAHTVKVRLPSLGCALTAEVAKSNIEVIQAYNRIISKGA